MFIQVITGKVTDEAEFQRVGELWETKVRPVAKGYLGVTEGVTDDGRFFVAARFESAAAAAENSDLPEQTEWYQEFEKTASDVQFHDCSDVITMLGGGSDDAGFVQVMVGKIKDRAKFDALNAKSAEMERVFSEWRDDVLGEVLARPRRRHRLHRRHLLQVGGRGASGREAGADGRGAGADGRDGRGGGDRRVPRPQGSDPALTGGRQRSSNADTTASTSAASES